MPGHRHSARIGGVAPLRIALFALAVAVLSALLAATAPQASAAPPRSPTAALWPVPVPTWFWEWARWYLHRGEFRDQPIRSPETRPAEAPRLIPAWGWRRLRVILGKPAAPLPDEPLSLGSEGQTVWVLQRTLRTLRYPAGPLDGVFGEKTQSAVVAFQKLHGLELDKTVSAEEYEQILRARRPEPPLARSGTYVYVDLDRQILFDVRAGRVRAVLPVSTGGGYTYTGLDGRDHVATTPAGSFRIIRKVPGWDVSYLGRLYYPTYFRGGYAIHGATSVPIRPISHGCVRIPIWFAEDFYADHPVGTRIVVR